MSRTKYILIDRGSDFPLIATTPEVIADWDNCIYKAPIVSQRPVTMAEIRKHRFHVFSTEAHLMHRERDARREALFKWAAGVKFGVVRWFDNVRGEGMIDCDGHTLPIYACNIKGRKTWYPETACVYYEEGQVVDCHIEVHGYQSYFVIGDTPGHFDAEGWDRIKGQNLAFRCDEEGNAITGLFG